MSFGDAYSSLASLICLPIHKKREKITEERRENKKGSRKERKTEIKTERQR